MNSTLQLLKLLSTADKTTVPRGLSETESLYLHKCSIKNRMSFLYLEALRRSNSLTVLESIYKEEKKKYTRTFAAISRVSKLLMERNIEHVVFKTIRPYVSTTVDIDTLILGGREEYMESIKTMKEAGYRLIVRGPRSTTLWDNRVNIGVDLYEQVAVSFITYIDKQELTKYATITTQQNGEHIRVLKPEADLTCIIAHSLIKEQMYTLSEYYSFINYLEQLDTDEFVDIANRTNLTSAIRTHAAITALLHSAAHGTIPSKLEQILDYLGDNKLEGKILMKRKFETPHKYHPTTVTKSLLEIAKGKKVRRSMAIQALHMLDPQFAKKFASVLVEHTIRKTY